MTRLGLKAIDSFKYMSKLFAGEELVGQTYKDHLNFVYKLKMLEIEGGDGQNVLNMLYERGLVDANFFYKLRIDDDGRLCGVFMERFNDVRGL